MAAGIGRVSASAPNLRPPLWVAVARRNAQDLTLEGLLEPWGERFNGVHVLLVDGGRPTGWLTAPGGPPPKEELAARFGGSDARRGTDAAVPEGADAALPSTTVVVCTRERPLALGRCLRSMAGALAPGVNVLVVDNAPRSASTAAVVDDAGVAGLPVHRVVATRRGLSVARNTALAASTSEVLAFVDDDTVVDPGWLGPLRHAFAADRSVSAAVGLVPSAQLDTAAQYELERRLAWATRLVPARLSLRSDPVPPRPFPYNAGQIGTGANMAVRRQALLDVGGFDPALGAGRLTRGGEDLEIFVRLLRRGRTVAYEPSSIVWHFHPAEMSELRRKMFGYGAGVTAYLASLLAQPERVDLVSALASYARFGLRRRQGALRSRRDVPLALLECAGLVWGPVAYGAERLRVRRSP
ncbi:MAG: glycosyltransferase family 2 protein [Acidimicrobiales bacterium]